MATHCTYYFLQELISHVVVMLPSCILLTVPSSYLQEAKKKAREDRFGKLTGPPKEAAVATADEEK